MDFLAELHLTNDGSLEVKPNAHVIKLPLPAPYMTMNQRKHWTWNAKTKKSWREATVYASCNWRAGYEQRRLSSKAVVKFVFPVTSNRRRDPHNYYPTIKSIVDGLTDANLWPDDTSKYVETREPVFAICPEVYIIIEEM